MVKGQMDLVPPTRRVESLLLTMQQSDNYKLVTFTFGSKLHGQWGPRLKRSVRRGRSGLPWRSSWLLGVLLCSQVFLALRWTMPGTVLGDVASQRGFTCLLSLPMWGSMWTG
jgi:hypothetical protein